MIFYDVLLIHPSAASRSKLKSAALALPAFRKTHNASSLNDGVEFLKGPDKVNVVFLAYNFGLSAIGEFVKAAKATIHGEDCAYVVVFDTSSQDNSEFAEVLMEGADSVLCEPYSLDGLQEIARLASTINKNNEERRQKAAIYLLVTRAMVELDKLSRFIAAGINVERGRIKFAQFCKSIERFNSGESAGLYMSVLIEAFSKAPIPPAKKVYKGASVRVKQRIDDRLNEEYKSHLEEENSR
jgi:hypothetical protein